MLSKLVSDMIGALTDVKTALDPESKEHDRVVDLLKTWEMKKCVLTASNRTRVRLAEKIEPLTDRSATSIVEIGVPDEARPAVRHCRSTADRPWRDGREDMAAAAEQGHGVRSAAKGLPHRRP